MNNGVNKVTLMGTVGRDPESRFISDTSRVTTFPMATNETYTDKAGVKQEKVEWHNVEAWGYLADTFVNYVKKGNNVLIYGKIKTESYVDKNTNAKVYKTKIVANEFYFLPGNKKNEEQPASGNQQQPAIRPPASAPAPAIRPPASAPAPAIRPPASAPINTPAVAENAAQQVDNYVTSEEFMQDLIPPDDLPF